MAVRGPRGISTSYSGYSSFRRSGNDELTLSGYLLDSKCTWSTSSGYLLDVERRAQ